jgi:nitroreductase
MTLDEIIATRRSIRGYETRPVEDEKIAAILEAGRLAPSARNRQDWKFVVVTNDTVRAQLAVACRDQQYVSQAPVALVVTASHEDFMMCKQSAATIDCSIAFTFMLLKATELGLGTCWLGAFDADKVSEVLNLPEGTIPVAVTPIGYPAESPSARPRKAGDEVYEFIT